MTKEKKRKESPKKRKESPKKRKESPKKRTESPKKRTRKNSGFFEDDDIITVEEKEIVPEYQRIYDNDLIYEKDLERSLLKLVPLNRQNNFFVQRNIFQEVKRIISLKNKGIDIIKRGEGWYKTIDQIQHGYFQSRWIIPLIVDKKKVYSRISTIGISEDDIHSSKKEGIELVDAKEILLTEKNLENKYTKNKLNYNEYYHDLFEAIKPYQASNQNQNGYHINANQSTEGLRLYGYDTKYWETRVALGPYYTTYETFDELNKKKVTDRNIIISGEKLQIVGLLILPINYDNLLDIIEGNCSFFRFGELGTITTIKKGNITTIKVTNHQLERTDHLLIEGNPILNGFYDNTEFKIIDKDTINLKIDTSNYLKISTGGRLFGTTPLNLEVKEQQENGKTILESKPQNTEKPHGNLYLFDNIAVKDPNVLIKNIIPSINDIINQIIIDFSKENKIITLSQIMDQLELYGVNISDLNENNFIPFKKVLAIPFKSSNKKIKNELISSKKSIIPEKISPYLDNDFFNSPMIIKYYGQYPFLNTSLDNNLSRIQWLEKQSDQGNLYFINTALILEREKIRQKNTLNIDQEIKLTELNIKKESNEIKRVEKDDKLLKRCSNFKLSYKKEYYNYQELNIEYLKLKQNFFINCPFKSGDLVLTKDTGQIYKWIENAWVLNKKFPTERSICLQNGLDLNLLDLNQLNCLYDNFNNCVSSRIYRLYQRQKNNTVYLESLKSLKRRFKNHQRITDLEKELQEAIKHVSPKEMVKPNSKSKIKELSKLKEIKVDNELFGNPIFERILKIKEVSIRNDLIFSLIEKNGVLIDNWIYSRTTKRPMVCGHWEFLRLENIASNNKEKALARSSLFDIFGDRGEAVVGVQTCKICGYTLDLLEYDAGEGLTSDGKIIIRTRLFEKDRYATEKTLEEYEENEEVADSYKKRCRFIKFDCQSIQFTNLLKRKKIATSNKILEASKNICGKINIYLDRMSIVLSEDHFITTLIDILRYYQNYIPSEDQFIQLGKIQAQRSGRPFNLNKIQQQYPYQINPLQVAAIAARLLITLETAVPQYYIGKLQTKCNFDGFTVSFMACLTKETTLADTLTSKKLYTISLESIKNSIEQSYQKYKNTYTNVKELYTRFKIYKNNKKELEYPNDKRYQRPTIFNERKIDNLEKSKLFKATNINSLKENREKLDVQNLLIGLEIIKIINRYVENGSPVLPINDVFPENSCCLENISKYENYNEEINFFSKGELNKVISKAKLAYDLSQFLLIENQRSISINYFPNYVRHIRFLDLNDEKLDQMLFNLKFIVFCFTTVSRGEYHSFDELDKCIKCQLTKENILKKNYTREEYDKLLESIQKKTELKVTHIEIKNEYPKNIQSQVTINRNITRLVNDLFKILGQQGNKNAIEEYENLLFNLGNYNNISQQRKKNLEVLKADSKDIIEANNLELNEKIERVKRYYNSFLRRDISITLHRYKKKNLIIDSIELSKEDRNELQRFIFDKYDQISEYIKPEYASIFSKIKLKHSLDEINRINGTPDIYNDDYSKIEIYSVFDLLKAYNLLKFNFIEELLHMLDTAKHKKIIAKFILMILNKIKDEVKNLDINPECINDYNTQIYDQMSTRKITEITSINNNIEDIDNIIETNLENEKIIYEDKMKHLHIRNIVKTELQKRGEELTDDQIDNSVDQIIKEEQEEEDEQLKEDKDFEVGIDYGDLGENVYDDDDDDIL